MKPDLVCPLLVRVAHRYLLVVEETGLGFEKITLVGWVGHSRKRVPQNIRAEMDSEHGRNRPSLEQTQFYI